MKIKRVYSLYNKYKEIINYLIFGVLTTIISLLVYYGLTFTVMNPDKPVSLQIANFISWVAGVIFAYVTNRSFVFKDKAHGKKAIMKEMTSFFACRIFTMVVDTAIYWIGCTTLKFPALIVKMVSQVVVIVLNYVFSKLIVFKKKSTDK